MNSGTEEISGVCKKCGTSLSDCSCRNNLKVASSLENGDTLAVRELQEQHADPPGSPELVAATRGSTAYRGVSTTGEYPSHALDLQEVFERRYEVIRKIGAGGMGTVYKAEHVVLRKRVALKVLKQSLASDKLAVARFEREAQACASLQHPNLMQIFDCGVTSEGCPYLVMEYISGRNVAQMIKEEKKLSKEVFFDIFVPVCNGLAYAHTLGVIHRDLKPENIVMAQTAAGEVPKLVDFGIAKVEEMGGQLQVLTQTGELLGSPSYMSPEQCAGKTVDGRTDIYSLGCVMYEALTGKKAFYGENISTLLMNQMRREPDPPEKINSGKDELTAAVGGIIMRCLVKDAEGRIQSMNELSGLLQQAKGRLDQKRVLGFRLPHSDSTDHKILVALSLCMVVVGGTIAFMLLSKVDPQAPKKLPEPLQPVRMRDANGRSPLSLMAKSFYMKKDYLPGSSAAMHEALVQAKRGNLPDVDRLAIAFQLMEMYTVDFWENEKALAVFKEVTPSLNRLSARLNKKQGPAVYTGVAPYICLLAARAELQLNNPAAAVANCKKGLTMTGGQKDGPWMAARLENMEGQALIKMNKLDEARICLQSSVNAMTEILGNESNHNVAEGYRFLARIFMMRENYEQATKLTQHGIAILRPSLTENWRIARDYDPQLQEIDAKAGFKKK